MKISLIAIMTFAAVSTHAQETWTMQQCMQYAVEHNHEVKRAELELDNYKAAKTAAVGRFLPAIDASIGAQYNFGRAINPETNGYTDVSTFYNGYSLQASLPVFDGFSRIHALKAAKASMLMGRHALRVQQDHVALNVLQAFTNTVYYEGLVKMAGEKVKETELLLHQTRLLEEVGRKSSADVAQVEAQKAEADYELLRQQNLHASALLELKKSMGYPLNESIVLAPKEIWVSAYSDEILDSKTDCSTLLGRGVGDEAVARYQMQVAKHEWHQARAALYPSLSLSAGLNTTYYHTLHTSTGQAFHTQIKNNMGEYIGITLSIPLFNRLQTITNIRKAKNNYRIACENYEQKQLELEKLSREAWQDWQGYLMQTEQMTKKVEADSIAYQLTRRQFEEGLATAIDLRTTSAQLLNSKATLLQCRLMAIVKEHLVRYYRGESIWE
jgi:outer membrane protein